MNTHKSLDDIHFNYEKDGVLVRKQLSKKLLSKNGTWALVGAVHQDVNYNGDLKEPKITIARFKNAKAVWKKQSGFNINSKEQAEAVIEFLKESFQIGE